MSRNEDSRDGEEVIRELGPTIARACAEALNHEPRACFAKHGFHEVCGKSTESVSVGNHNLFDSSIVYSFQKGRKAAPLEVEAAPDVADDLMLWELASEIVDLASKVGSLVLGADAGIDDSGARRRFVARRGGISDGLPYVFYRIATPTGV